MFLEICIPPLNLTIIARLCLNRFYGHYLLVEDQYYVVTILDHVEYFKNV